MDKRNKMIRSRSDGSRLRARRIVLGAVLSLMVCGAVPIFTIGAEPAAPQGTLDETRLALNKWIDTQRMITKERNEWQQGKEILANRIQLVESEIAGIEAQIKKSEAVVADAQKKRDELQKQLDEVKTVKTQLTQTVGELEAEVHKLHKQLPAPVQQKLKDVYTLIPLDPANTKAEFADRYQKVALVLTAMNNANNDITVNYEVHGGTESRAVYIGLAQAYYLSPNGTAGIGRPTADGWTWETSATISNDVLKVLEMSQGKESPNFVPLPMKIQ